MANVVNEKGIAKDIYHKSVLHVRFMNLNDGNVVLFSKHRFGDKTFAIQGDIIPNDKCLAWFTIGYPEREDTIYINLKRPVARMHDKGYLTHKKVNGDIVHYGPVASVNGLRRIFKVRTAEAKEMVQVLNKYVKYALDHDLNNLKKEEA